jgi:spore cortex biosynthesis protein YabQ
MITVMDQIRVFLYAIAGGAAVALLYDLLRIKRRAIKSSVIIVNIEDLLYWLAAAVLIFFTVYSSNSGEIRGYIFIGNIIGVALYLLLLSKIVIASSMAIINLVKKILMFLWSVISYPFKLLFKIFRVPIVYIARLFKRLARCMTRLATNRLKKIRIWLKILKNITKKS